MPSHLLFRAIPFLIGLSLISVGPIATRATQKPRVRKTQRPKPSEKRPLTNADVVRMVKHAFSDDSVITTIQSSKTQFDLSVDALIELKTAGVSERIISVMQAPQGTPRSSTGPRVARRSGDEAKIASG